MRRMVRTKIYSIIFHGYISVGLLLPHVAPLSLWTVMKAPSQFPYPTPKIVGTSRRSTY